jgi:hypothetical protein
MNATCDGGRMGAHMRGLLALLLLVGPLGALAASRFHERNHTGLLFLYTFGEGQVPTSPPSEVHDVSGRHLMGNLTASTTGTILWSAARQGVSVPSINGGTRAVSQKTSVNLIPRLTSEFSFEFFLSNPNSPLSQNILIAGFGDWPPGAPFARCDVTNTVSEGGWRMFTSLGGGIEVEAVLLMDGTPTCVLNSFALPTNTLRHVVIRVGNGRFSMVSHDSSATIVEGIEFSPALWARHAAPLTIASPHPGLGWTGTMYMMAMYDRFLSSAEIAANRNFGPPNSVPYGAGAVEADEDVPTPLVTAVA